MIVSQTFSHPWMMQCASATVIGAFAASIWIAGQSFIERGTGPLHALDATTIASRSCSQRAVTDGAREEIAHRPLRSCGLTRR